MCGAGSPKLLPDQRRGGKATDAKAAVDVHPQPLDLFGRRTKSKKTNK